MASKSSRRNKHETKNANFRSKFELPEEETIVDDFSCAISQDVLLHGRMYVSQGWVCFYSNIFGHRTTEVMPMARITAIEKKNTSLFIPNAIEVTVAREDGTTARHFFASFQERDACHTVLRKMWDEHKSGARARPAAAAPTVAATRRRQPEPEPEPEQQPAATSSAATPEAAGDAAAAAEQEEVDIMLVADENQVRLSSTF